LIKIANRRSSLEI